MAGRKPETPDSHFLAVFIGADDPVLTAVEVSEELDMTQQGAHNRLTSLVDSGLLATKKVGSRARVYWITRAGKKYFSESVQSEE